MIASRAPAAPEWLIVCGSGLGSLAGLIEDACVLPYDEIPHFVPATAPGHSGRLHLGTLAGRPVACMQGRLHCYEGYTARQVAYPIYTLAALGVRHVIVTNAAGAIDTAYNVGDIMLIADHINFTGGNPLTLDAADPMPMRGLDMSFAYTPALRNAARGAADKNGIVLREGIYLGLSGPSFETPAEIRAFRTWGASAVGMSTVHEVIAAATQGIEVLGLSLMTNMAAGILPQAITVEEINEVSATRIEQMGTIIEGVVS